MEGREEVKEINYEVLSLCNFSSFTMASRLCSAAYNSGVRPELSFTSASTPLVASNSFTIALFPDPYIAAVYDSGVWPELPFVLASTPQSLVAA